MTIEHRVEKQIELKAPVARVWRALTDYREFGEWFRVKLDGPFVPGTAIDRPHHLAGIRAYKVGSRRSQDGTRKILLVHMASLCNRSEY